MVQRMGLCALLVVANLACAACHSITTYKDAEAATIGTAVPIGGGAVCDELGPNQFHVTLPRVQASAVKQREHSQWCWAACAEMVLAAKGQHFTQEQIAQPFVGFDLDSSVKPLHIMRVLNPDLEARYREVMYRDGQDRGSGTLANHLGSHGTEISSDRIVKELSAGEPLVVGLCEDGAATGHVCVICGATYGEVRPPDGALGWFIGGFKESRDGVLIDASARLNPHYLLYSVDIIDPDPDVAMYRTIEAPSLKQSITLLMTQPLARKVVQQIIEEGPGRNGEVTRTTTSYRWNAKGRSPVLEGRDFQIMYYGGRLRAHLSIGETLDDLVDVLVLARKVVVVADSDKISEVDSIDETKQRLDAECVKAGGLSWITDGREIENYLPDAAIDRTLKRLLGESHRPVSVGQFQKLGDALLAAYPDVPRGLAWIRTYDNNKAKGMKEFLADLEANDLEQWGLRTRLSALVDFIQKGNPSYRAV